MHAQRHTPRQPHADEAIEVAGAERLEPQSRLEHVGCRHDFELYGDDVASLQIVPANTRVFADVVAAQFPTAQHQTFDAGLGGWFPFRAAVVGKTEVLRNNSTNGDRWHMPLMFDGDPVGGPWTLHVDDQSGAMTGSLASWTLTVITQGGPGQIAERSEWVSTVKDLELEGKVTSIVAIDAGLALPPGSAAELYLRTCPTPDACDVAPWSGPHAPGAPLSVASERYAQLRVVMTSNGVDEPAVDFIELSYQAAQP